MKYVCLKAKELRFFAFFLEKRYSMKYTYNK